MRPDGAYVLGDNAVVTRETWTDSEITPKAGRVVIAAVINAARVGEQSAVE